MVAVFMLYGKSEIPQRKPLILALRWQLLRTGLTMEPHLIDFQISDVFQQVQVSSVLSSVDTSGNTLDNV